MPTKSSRKRAKKARHTTAPRFTELKHWLSEVLFELKDGNRIITYRRDDFARKGIINTGAILRVRKYIKRHKLTSFEELWNTNPFTIGGERTIWVAMHVLEDAYDHPENWFEDYLEKPDDR